MTQERRQAIRRRILDSLAPNPLTGRHRDEVLRQLRHLESLEERALAAYERGDYELAEHLDAEYAEGIDALEHWTEEILEGDIHEGLEPGETDVAPAIEDPTDTVMTRTPRVGPEAPPVTRDLSGDLATLYEQYLRNLNEPKTLLMYEVMDPETFKDFDTPFPIRTIEDVAALRGRTIIEEAFEEPLPHVPPGEILDAMRDAWERRAKLKERYRATATRKMTPNRASAPSPRVRAVFDELVDVISEGRFRDFGDIGLVMDPVAGEGGARQFAYCRVDGDDITIAFAPKAESLPRPNLVGLMAHELGHAIDFRYPETEIVERTGLELAPGLERRADQIAEAVLGTQIRYDDGDVQCVGHGRAPRPAYLAQNPDPGPADVRVQVRFPRTPNRPGSVRLELDEGHGTTTVATAALAVGDTVVHVQEAQVAEDNRGVGLGLRLYQEVFRAAAERGLAVESDTSRSDDAERMWRRLEQLGVARGEGRQGTRLVPLTGRVFGFRQSGSWPFLRWRVDDPAAAAAALER